MNRIIGRHLLAFVLASIVALPAPRLHAAANPVATYAFNETSGPTTVDGSGNGFTGTLTNSPTFVAGKYGNALSFNATDDGNDSNDPRVGLGRTINVPNLPFTFSAWVNPASYADWRAIFSKRDSPSSTNRRLDVGLASGSGRVYLATGATTRTFVYGAPLNVWTHLTVVAEAGGTKLYVNGVLRETLAAITLGTNTNANTVIGGTGEGTPGDNDPFKGMIDDVRLYARALTQSEIDSDMNTSAGVPDTEFPTVAMTAPAAGTVSGTSVTVSANASDNVAVAGVQFQLDGVNLGAEDTSAPYSIVWNSVTATNAAHTLTAIARDAAGNATTSAGVAVTVSNPPVLVITQPTNGATTSGTSVNITYTTTGNLTGVSHVHFVLDSNPQVMDLSFDGAYTMANVLPGAHVLNGFLVNSSHVKIPGSDAAPVNFTSTAPDTIPPTGVAITSPAASSTLSGTVTITADATDNTGVVGVQFRIGAQNITPEDTSAPYSVSFNTLTVPNGAYTLTAVARDAAGNQTTSP
ncbi:MAG TPA: Ig-like domain-containing protein, partial [Candidatus Eisenbacteria bacterium]|nr:Ig-like domain-containing protein [Candidatus Eisenbacteria bacterium]